MLWEPLPATWPDASPPLMIMGWSANIVYMGKVLSPRTNGRFLKKNPEIHCAMIPLVSATLLWNYHCFTSSGCLAASSLELWKRAAIHSILLFDSTVQDAVNCFTTANSHSPNPVAFMLNGNKNWRCKGWDLDNDVSFYTYRILGLGAAIPAGETTRVAVPVKLLVINLSNKSELCYYLSLRK